MENLFMSKIGILYLLIYSYIIIYIYILIRAWNTSVSSKKFRYNKASVVNMIHDRRSSNNYLEIQES